MFLKNAISQLLDCKQFSQPLEIPPAPTNSSFSLFDALKTENKKDEVEIIEDEKPVEKAKSIPLINLTKRN